MNVDQVQRKLGEILTPVQTFNQGELAKAAGMGSALGAGYCHGMCIDWIRRVVTRPTAKSLSFKLPDDEDGDKLKLQVARQIRFQRTISAQRQEVTRQKPIHKARTDAAYGLDGLKKFIVDTVQLNPDVESYGKDELFGSVRHALDEVSPDLYGRLPDTLSKRDALVFAKSLMVRRAAYDESVRINSGQAERGHYPEIWALSLPALGATLQGIRARSGRDTASTRGFEKLSITKTSPELGADTGADACTMASLSVKTGQAVEIGFRIGTGGHATALWRHKDNSWFFLDPNYGIYAGTIGAVKGAYSLLFNPAGHREPGVYNDDELPDSGQVTGRYDYVVFGSA